MGFGLLFIGYFLEYLLGLNQLGTFTHVIGYMVMFVGLSRLRLYCRTFVYAQYATVVLMLPAVYRTFAHLSELFDMTFSFVTPILTLVVELLNHGLFLLFHVLLSVALMEICNRTGVKKNAIRALQNLVIVVTQSLLQFYLLPLGSGGIAASALFYTLSLLLNLVWVICNLVLIGSCYMRICPAGEANGEKPKKPSRFAFVNDMRERYQRSEDKAIREDRAYHQQRYQEQLQKVKAKGKANPKGRAKTRAEKRAEIEAARKASRERDL